MQPFEIIEAAVAHNYPHHLFRLSETVFQRIIDHLNSTDLKSFSLTSYGLLLRIENVQKWAPRLHLLAIASTAQNESAARMIPEAYPGSYILQRGAKPIQDGKLQELVSSSSSPASPPTYDEARTATWLPAVDFRARWMVFRGWNEDNRIWICPHRGCSFEGLLELLNTQQHLKPPPDICDTTSALCPFPKCSLWARHALVRTRKVPEIYEMCSVIRLYRRQFLNLGDVRRALKSDKFHRQLLRAISRLRIHMCKHLRIGEVKIQQCDLEDVLLEASQSHVDIAQFRTLEAAIDKRSCAKCQALGTYTTWGFVARYTEDSQRLWLDIELMLCRPMFDCASRLRDVSSGCDSPHWRYHALDGVSTIWYRLWWSNWARIVAQDGFDWRAQLPPAFLKPKTRGLLDFPQRRSNSGVLTDILLSREFRSSFAADDKVNPVSAVK